MTRVRLRWAAGLGTAKTTRLWAFAGCCLRYGFGWRRCRAGCWGRRFVLATPAQNPVLSPLIANCGRGSRALKTVLFRLRVIILCCVNYMGVASRARNFWNVFATSLSMAVLMFTACPIGHRECAARRLWRYSRAGTFACRAACAMPISRPIRAA